MAVPGGFPLRHHFICLIVLSPFVQKHPHLFAEVHKACVFVAYHSLNILQVFPFETLFLHFDMSSWGGCGEARRRDSCVLFHALHEESI